MWRAEALDLRWLAALQSSHHQAALAPNAHTESIERPNLAATPWAGPVDPPKAGRQSLIELL